VIFAVQALIQANARGSRRVPRTVATVLLFAIVVAFAGFQTALGAAYVGSASVASPNSSVQSAATEILT
jgi:FlaG/FlaF family flagellin (archaellin)